MIDKIFHILAEHDLRLMMPYNPCNIKKQCAPRIVKALFPSCQGERLARKAGQQYVMRRNILFIDLGDVANYIEIVLEICRIRFCRSFIQLTCKNSFYVIHERLLEAEPYAANAGK